MLHEHVYVYISIFIMWVYNIRVYNIRTSIDIMKDNGFKQAKERNRKYPEQTPMT